MLRNKKSMFSDEEESEDEDENAVRASQRNVFESDEEEGEGNGSPSSKKSNKGKQKRKRGGLLLDSDHDGGDSDSFENISSSKTKNRRGIIAYDSDSGDSDSSSGREGDGDGDDEENLCPICLGDFEDQMVGIPENCSHIFCITCIQEWSKNVNNCPVDRIKFNKITIKDMNGKFIDDVIVEDVKKDDNISDDPPTYCQVCGQCDREDCMLLCDECDNGYHMDCLTPPLECVPIDEWYCVECTPTEVSAPTSTRTRRATTNDEPARTNRRSRRRSNNTNNESEDEREELVSSLMSDVMGAINRWGRGNS